MSFWQIPAVESFVSQPSTDQTSMERICQKLKFMFRVLLNWDPAVISALLRCLLNLKITKVIDEFYLAGEF